MAIKNDTGYTEGGAPSIMCEATLPDELNTFYDHTNLLNTSPFHIQRIIGMVKAHLLSTFVFFHAEPSSSSIKLHQCVSSYSMLALWIQRRHGSTGHDVKICVIFFFPQCPPVNLNMYPLTVYNHMDAVIMCCG